MPDELSRTTEPMALGYAVLTGTRLSSIPIIAMEISHIPLKPKDEFQTTEKAGSKNNTQFEGNDLHARFVWL